MSLFKRFSRFFTNKVRGFGDKETDGNMRSREDTDVICVDSDEEIEPSWRGIRHQGTQLAVERTEKLTESIVEHCEQRIEAVDIIEKCQQPVFEIKAEPPDTYDLDSYEYKDITFIDITDDEDDWLEPLHRMKQEPIEMSSQFDDTSRQIEHPSELCCRTLDETERSSFGAAWSRRLEENESQQEDAEIETEHLGNLSPDRSFYENRSDARVVLVPLRELQSVQVNKSIGGGEKTEENVLEVDENSVEISEDSSNAEKETCGAFPVDENSVEKSESAEIAGFWLKTSGKSEENHMNEVKVIEKSGSRTTTDGDAMYSDFEAMTNFEVRKAEEGKMSCDNLEENFSEEDGKTVEIQSNGEIQSSSNEKREFSEHTEIEAHSGEGSSIDVESGEFEKFYCFGRNESCDAESSLEQSVNEVSHIFDEISAVYYDEISPSIDERQKVRSFEENSANERFEDMSERLDEEKTSKTSSEEVENSNEKMNEHCDENTEISEPSKIFDDKSFTEDTEEMLSYFVEKTSEEEEKEKNDMMSENHEHNRINFSVAETSLKGHESVESNTITCKMPSEQNEDDNIAVSMARTSPEDNESPDIQVARAETSSSTKKCDEIVDLMGLISPHLRENDQMNFSCNRTSTGGETSESLGDSAQKVLDVSKLISEVEPGEETHVMNEFESLVENESVDASEVSSEVYEPEAMELSLTSGSRGQDDDSKTANSGENQLKARENEEKPDESSKLVDAILSELIQNAERQSSVEKMEVSAEKSSDEAEELGQIDNASVIVQNCAESNEKSDELVENSPEVEVSGEEMEISGEKSSVEVDEFFKINRIPIVIENSPEVEKSVKISEINENSLNIEISPDEIEISVEKFSDTNDESFEIHDCPITIAESPKIDEKSAESEEIIENSPKIEISPLQAKVSVKKSSDEVVSLDIGESSVIAGNSSKTDEKSSEIGENSSNLQISPEKMEVSPENTFQEPDELPKINENLLDTDEISLFTGEIDEIPVVLQDSPANDEKSDDKMEISPIKSSKSADKPFKNDETSLVIQTSLENGEKSSETSEIVEISSKTKISAEQMEISSVMSKSADELSENDETSSESSNIMDNSSEIEILTDDMEISTAKLSSGSDESFQIDEISAPIANSSENCEKFAEEEKDDENSAKIEVSVGETEMSIDEASSDAATSGESQHVYELPIVLGSTSQGQKESSEFCNILEIPEIEEKVDVSGEKASDEIDELLEISEIPLVIGETSEIEEKSSETAEIAENSEIQVSAECMELSSQKSAEDTYATSKIIEVSNSSENLPESEENSFEVCEVDKISEKSDSSTTQILNDVSERRGEDELVSLVDNDTVSLASTIGDTRREEFSDDIENGTEPQMETSNDDSFNVSTIKRGIVGKTSTPYGPRKRSRDDQEACERVVKIPRSDLPMEQTTNGNLPGKPAGRGKSLCSAEDDDVEMSEAASSPRKPTAADNLADINSPTSLIQIVNNIIIDEKQIHRKEKFDDGAVEEKNESNGDDSEVICRQSAVRLYQIRIEDAAACTNGAGVEFKRKQPAPTSKSSRSPLQIEGDIPEGVEKTSAPQGSPIGAKPVKNDEDIVENRKFPTKRKKSEKAVHSRKKRKLFSQSDDLEDLLDFRESTESSRDAPLNDSPMESLDVDSRDTGIDSPRSSQISEECGKSEVENEETPEETQNDIVRPENQSSLLSEDEETTEDTATNPNKSTELQISMDLLSEDEEIPETSSEPQQEPNLLSEDEEVPNDAPLPETNSTNASGSSSVVEFLTDDELMYEEEDVPIPGPSRVHQSHDDCVTSDFLSEDDAENSDTTALISEDDDVDDGRSKFPWDPLSQQLKQKRSRMKSTVKLEPDTQNLSPPKIENYNVVHEEPKLTAKSMEELLRALTEKPDPEVRMEGPRGLRVKLMPHQEHALAWMLWRENSKPAGGILADDMGLGKTIVAIALIMKSMELEPLEEDETGGTLIVCPANLINQWHNEIQQRARGDVRSVHKFHGSGREARMKILRNYAVVVTSYDTLTSNWREQDDTKRKQNQRAVKSILFKVRWKRVILDEAHIVRNDRTQRSMCVEYLKAEKRWALTGTPIQNRIFDLFGIARFLRLTPFHVAKQFNQRIVNCGASGVKRLRCLMDSVMLRRTKAQLVAAGRMPGLPSQVKEVVKIDLDSEERLVYEKVMLRSKSLFIQYLLHLKQKRGEPVNVDFQLSRGQLRALEAAGDVQQHTILTQILRLRQICCHPALVCEELTKDDLAEAGIEEEEVGCALKASGNFLEEDEADDIGIDERVMRTNPLKRSNPVFKVEHRSSKVSAIMERIRVIVATGEKVIIVSEFVRYLQIIAHHLQNLPEQPKVVFQYYTGKTGPDARDAIVELFNTKAHPNVLLLSMKAGGQGLNLMAANHVVLVDIPWNPQLEIQAQDRVYRIGQKRKVFVHKFVCTNTIEERIVELQEKKLSIADEVLSGIRREVRMAVEDLCLLFDVK